MLENDSLEEGNSDSLDLSNTTNKATNSTVGNKADNQADNQIKDTTNNVESEEIMQDEDKAKKKKSKEDPFNNINVLYEPKRKLPKVIDIALENNIPVTLSKNGYFLGGFYGLNHDNQHEGFAFAQETSEDNSLVFYDMKGHKFLVKDFEDLVKFHNHVWGQFYKVSDSYKKPDMLWFGFLLQYGVLNITPGSMK